MQKDAGLTLSVLNVDGGAAVNDQLMQFQADLLGVPVRRPASTEATARGAAFLAGLAVGYWPDREALSRIWTLDRQFAPAMDNATRARLRTGWQKAVSRALDWA
jgi:glycerol kinase